MAAAFVAFLIGLKMRARFKGRVGVSAPVNSPVLRDPNSVFLSHLQAYFRQHP